MTGISSSEIVFHPHSIADYKMRLFQWSGKLYRGIGCERAPFFTQLFQEGVIQQLVEKGLFIETELTPLKVNGFDMVVSHRSIPFTSYSIEWCPAMIKDAALTLLDVAIELARRGFALEDGHLGNVLFDGCEPFFVDLGSIRPFDEYVHYFRWDAYDQFCQVCLYPLLLMSQGKDKVARLLMVDNEGVLKTDLLLLTRRSGLSRRLSNPPLATRLQLGLMQIMPPEQLKLFREKLKFIQASLNKKTEGLQETKELQESSELQELNELQESKKLNQHTSCLEKITQKYYLISLEKIRQNVRNITLPCFKTLLPGESEAFSWSSCQDTWTAKQVSVYKTLTELHPSSVLDIGCHTGAYSKLAASLGSQVVAFDKDLACVTQLYYDAREKKLPILPLLMDFTQPTPAYGLSNYRYVAATERFQCEMVLALGLVHHIVFEQHPQFEQTVEGFALFSKRWLLVEFVPLEDPELAGFLSPRHSWYMLENFMNKLSKWFSSIHILPSDPELRVLLLCEK